MPMTWIIRTATTLGTSRTKAKQPPVRPRSPVGRCHRHPEQPGPDSRDQHRETAEALNTPCAEDCRSAANAEIHDLPTPSVQAVNSPQTPMNTHASTGLDVSPKTDIPDGEEHQSDTEYRGPRQSVVPLQRGSSPARTPGCR